jgi:predicted lipoprotein
MRHGLFIFALALLFVATSALAQAEDAGLRTTLQSRYTAMKVAIATRDDKAVQALLAPDFLSIDASGQNENAGQMIQEVDSLPKDPTRTSTTTLLSVKLDGMVATVKQRYDMKKIKIATDGSKSNVELVTLSTDKWMNSNGTWLLQETVTDELNYYIDGQLSVHKVRQEQ